MPEKFVNPVDWIPIYDGGTTRFLRHGGYCLNPQLQNKAFGLSCLCVMCVSLLQIVRWPSDFFANGGRCFGKSPGFVGIDQALNGGAFHILCCGSAILGIGAAQDHSRFNRNITGGCF